MKHRYSILFFPLHVIADFLSLNLAFVGAYLLKFTTLVDLVEAPYTSLWLLFNLVWLIEILLLKPYVFPRQLFKVDYLLKKLLLLTAIHIAVISIYWVAVRGYYYSREHLLFTYAIFLLLGAIVRVGGVMLLKEYRAHGYNSRRYVIVGYGKLAASIHSFYEAHPEMGFRFAGYFDQPSAENEFILAGTYKDLFAHIRRQGVDCVYCCLTYMDNEHLKQIVDQSEIDNYQVKLLVDFRGFLARSASVEYYDFLPVLNLSSNKFAELQINVFKRGFDVLFSVVALGLGMPIFLVLAAVTRATSSGPVFYAQERIGRGGKPFKIYKFRSMYVGSEQGGPVLSGGVLDDRITPWGRFMRKTRLDEIPQFYNVLVGDMSVVGPRPERQFFIDQIVQIAPDYKKLLTVRPGITSIGQIKYGYAASVDEMVQRLRYDLLYPKRRSFMFDMWIIAQTLRVMAQGRGK